MQQESVVDKLKKRKVIQWSVAYIAAAWVIAQVAEVVAGPWGLSLYWLRLLHVILIAGLPLVITLAWFHGDRGQQRVTRTEFALLAVIVAGAAYSIATTDFSDEAFATTARAAESPAVSSATSIPRLAVLAFSNLGSPEDTFFADGITAELGSRLSGLGGLALMSPSSAKAYKGSGQTPRQFGQTLGADYVLSGTVQWNRSNEGATSIRVIPEVIRISDDTQIWSSQLDKPFDDTLTMQSDIAVEVVDQLKITMSTSERQAVASRLTDSPLAFEAYLKGIQVLPDGHGAEEDFRKARQLLEQAVTLDSDFVEAWAEIADADMGLYWFGYDTHPSRLELAKTSIDRALEIDPESHVGRFRLGDYYYRQRNYTDALRTYSELFKERPNDAILMQFMGYLWRRQGLLDQGVEALEKALVLDPLNAYSAVETAWTQILVGNLQRAGELIEQARTVNPDEDWAYIVGAMHCWTVGGPNALQCSRDNLDRFPEARSLYPTFYRVQQHLMEGNPQAALDLVENYPEPVLLLQASYVPIEQLKGSLLVALGRNDEAKPLLQKAVDILKAERERNPDDFRLPLALARAYADLGMKDEALALAPLSAEMLPLSIDALIGVDVLYGTAELYALIGEDDLALDTMAKIYSVPAPYRKSWWSLNPAFAHLVDNQRFQDLLKQP